MSLCGKPQNEKGLSPGTTFGCRVAVQTPLADSDDGTPVFLASGDSVYHTVVPTVHGKALMKGKEGVAIPTILDDPINAHKIDLMQHIAEIQSLKMKESEGARRGRCFCTGFVVDFFSTKAAYWIMLHGKETKSEAWKVSEPH